MKHKKNKQYISRTERHAWWKAVGLVVCVCVAAGVCFGRYKAMQNPKIGWNENDGQRWFVSSTERLPLYGLYEIEGELYYFGADGMVCTGWVREDGYVGYADETGRLLRGEAEAEGITYLFQPETGQLYTGWATLNGAEYCFDETGHPRTGSYEENGVVWALDKDGRLRERLNGWKEIDGVWCFFDGDGVLTQGWKEIDGEMHFFVDGVSRTGWVETENGTRYLDEDGRKVTGWYVIDGQPYAFDQDGALKQGWEHAHEKILYFTDGISRAGIFQKKGINYDLNGSGSVQPEPKSAEELLETTEDERLTEGEEGQFEMGEADRQPENVPDQMQAPELQAVTEQESAQGSEVEAEMEKAEATEVFAAPEQIEESTELEERTENA